MLEFWFLQKQNLQLFASKRAVDPPPSLTRVQKLHRGHTNACLVLLLSTQPPLLGKTDIYWYSNVLKLQAEGVVATRGRGPPGLRTRRIPSSWLKLPLLRQYSPVE